MKRNILFRVDCNKKIGFGHYVRCYNLASLFIKNKCSVTFLIKKDRGSLIFKNKKINFIFLDKNISLKKESEYISYLFKKKNFDRMILDLEHNLFKKKDYESFTQKLSSISSKIICWDNNITNKSEFGLTYRPYPKFLKLKKQNKNFKILEGINYFYSPLAKRIGKNNKIKNILINLGGTDQIKRIKNILNVLYNIKNNHRYNIIIPNHYKKINTTKIKRHNYTFPKLIENKELYNNIDLAIVSGGMSKYECIINFVPSIVINLNEQQKKVNFKFKDERHVLLLNNLKNFKQKFELIISNKYLRAKIIKNCKKIRKNYSERKIIKNLLF